MESNGYARQKYTNNKITTISEVPLTCNKQDKNHGEMWPWMDTEQKYLCAVSFVITI